MKKKLWIVLGALVAVVVLGFGMYHSDASQKNQVLTQEEVTDLVTSQYPGEITKMELKQNRTQEVYEIAIKGDHATYELKIDAKSGEVLQLKETQTLTAKENSTDDTTKEKKENSPVKSDKKEKKTPKKDMPKEETPQTSIEKKEQPKDTDEKQEVKEPEKEETGQTEEQDKKAVISQEEAIQIALNQFSGEVEDVDLEEEDGRLIYEIEIERGDLEAEIEIDAYTGEVIIMEIDD